jgi:hypothetical protein
MEMQWCGSFAQGRERGVNKFFLIILFLIGSVGSSAHSAPTELDLQFLNLPAYDLEKVSQPSDDSQTPSSSIFVGDRLELKLVSGSKDLKFAHSLPEDLQKQGWQLETDHEKLYARPLKPGQLTLPSLGLEDASGKTVARTNPFSAQVTSVIQEKDPQAKQPEGVEPPIALRFPFWIVGLMVGVALLVCGATIYFAYRWWKKRNPRIVPPVVDRRTEDEIAFAHLMELERQNLIQSGQYKIYYFRISEILKTYIGARYRFDAPESTTRELIVYLEEKKSIGDSLIDSVESLFDRLDRVKFTDYVPQSEDASLLLLDIKEFIQLTRRPPSLIPTEGAGHRAS